MLEAQVEVVGDPWRVEHRAHQAGAHLGGLQVGDPDPLDPLDRAQVGEQGLERARVAEVLAVGRGVLADEHQLTDPVTGQPPRLGHDVVVRARDEGPPEGRDRAERAAPVTAGGDLQRGHRSGRDPPADPARTHRARLCGQIHPRGRRTPVTGDVDGRAGPIRGRHGQQGAPVTRDVAGEAAALEDHAQPLGDVRVVVEPQDGVGLRQLRGQLACRSAQPCTRRPPRNGGGPRGSCPQRPAGRRRTRAWRPR